MKREPTDSLKPERPSADSRGRRSATAEDGRELRAAVQAFVRGLGLLSSDRTPWGERLAISHAHALFFLLDCSRSGAKPTQQDLGKTLCIDKSNVARLCARMEAARHITQERCREDGRARRLTLTENGLQLAARIEEASGDLFTAVMSVISPHARAGVLSALEELDAAVREVLRTRRKAPIERRSPSTKAK